MQRRALAEFLGTALLVMAVVGSGIMAQDLTKDVGLQLLANAIATGVSSIHHPIDRVLKPKAHKHLILKKKQAFLL
jgi:hypothetical protein